MKTLTKISTLLYFIAGVVIPLTVFIWSLMLILHPSTTTIPIIGGVVGLIGMLLVYHTFELKAINSYEVMKKDMKLVQFQELILKEMQFHHDRSFNLQQSNMDALTKMTAVANAAQSKNEKAN